MPPALLFFLRIALANWDLLLLHVNFRSILPTCELKKKKKCHWNLDRDCIKSTDGFG